MSLIVMSLQLVTLIANSQTPEMTFSAVIQLLKMGGQPSTLPLRANI